jgi:hypothetical protein
MSRHKGSLCRDLFFSRKSGGWWSDSSGRVPAYKIAFLNSNPSTKHTKKIALIEKSVYQVAGAGWAVRKAWLFSAVCMSECMFGVLLCSICLFIYLSLLFGRTGI